MATARRKRAAGFTLIEAVVALVIVALGMMALYMQLNQYAVTATYMEEKTLASWIATNELTELSIAPSWPELGTEEDEVEFAGRVWRYTVEVSETEVANLRRVDVSVARADQPERIIHKVSGLIEPPPPAGFIPPRWIGGPGGVG
ncbi:MAG TPA: type II secretion system minor pseudopilin GspI [Gammaproteobacteria bacterium]